MADSLSREPQNAEEVKRDELKSLAGKVLSVVAAGVTPATPAPAKDIVDQLVSAVLQNDDTERDRVVAQLLLDGTTIEDLIDHHIPDAARSLGQSWFDDKMSFVDVTIGSARLQSLLRDLARKQPAGSLEHALAPQVLMVVRCDEDHTLGAMVATQKLRRLGADVHVSVGRTDAQVVSALMSRHFDCVMISSSGSRRLETLREFVKNVRSRFGTTLPIVIGGSALWDHSDVTSLTGADFATTDPEEALRRCGLKIPCQGAKQRATLA